MKADNSRPMEGNALVDVLKELATVTVIADMLRTSLEPLSTEDIAAGAEPLTKEQIQEDLERISLIVTSVALVNLKAEPSEWYAANDSIE